MKTRTIFLVSIETKSVPTPEQVRGHIREAVAHWGGQFDPEHELFPTEIVKVQANFVAQVRK